jgi:hypothetical protein
MRRLALFVLLALLAWTGTEAQPIPTTLRQIQETQMDSLLLADTLQNAVPTRWTLQRSVAPYYGDTVTVTVLCVVPPKVLTFTAGGYTMLVYDTATVSNWGAMLVRCNAPADTAQNILDGFLNVQRGDIITMTGLISEFPLVDMNSVTQFQPIAGVPIVIQGTGTLPPYLPMHTGDFYRGIFPGGQVRYSTGEPKEGMLVQFTNLTVDARVFPERGTFSAVDSLGNQVSMYDASRYFTLGHGGTTPFPGDSLWATAYPPVGARIDTLRGYITTVSGSEGPRGYRISPIFRGDVKIGVILPSITSHTRNPIVVPPDSLARVRVRVTRQSGGYPLASIRMYRSVNYAPYSSIGMTYVPAETTYTASIPMQPANTFVRYFIQATDSLGNYSRLASSAFGGASSDTSKGVFFYTVLNRPLTIRDVQYTPYLNGRSAYIGAQVTVGGIVTADTAHIGISPLNTGGTNSWYMQTTNQPWNGIWFVGADTTLTGLQNGDSVSITGYVGENFDVTRLSGIQYPVTVISSGNPEPAPISLTSGTFGPTIGNGNPGAEPYEGMLVKLTNVKVTSVNPVFSDITEFSVDDGSGPMLVRRDGKHSYSNVPGEDSLYGRTILKVGDQLASLTGVLYYSFNRWKIVPRTNADIVPIRIPIAAGWNMVSSPTITTQDSVQQVFPTSLFDYGFSFDGAAGYQRKYNMETGRGYWAKFGGPATVYPPGAFLRDDTVAVEAGWNLVGSLSSSLDTAAINTNPPGITASLWFGFSGGYSAAAKLEPGKAYWMKASSAGVLYFSSTASEPSMFMRFGSDIASLNTMTISDALGNSQTLYFGVDTEGRIAVSRFAMPPPPPQGAFDARFESVDGGSMLRTISGATERAEFGIALSSDADPLTVAWNISQPSARYTLAQGTGAPKAMNATGSMKITSRNTNRLVLGATADATVPKEFALDQNYPNPFNPSTTLRYAVPVNAPVTLKIYNILGQEVATLVNEVQAPGIHTVIWNGTNSLGRSVGSGVYFSRLQAPKAGGIGEFVQVRKMMLIK